ncbi:lipopolysaccharide biosynthesis protein RfbH [bacterium]|nr:lipopolysaccharide biosynthesis protein RfbH [bacterium]
MTTPEQLKQEILAKTAEYYRLVHGSKPDFEPGKSPVSYAGRVFDEREMTNLVDSALEFWLTYGRYSRLFERGLARYLGLKHCLLVNSGSSANLLAFSTLTSPKLGDRRIRPGDEVITVAAGFPTTVSPVVQYGAVPVFVDVELTTANIDVSMLEAAVSPKTKAVMLAHTLGNPFDLDAVAAFCEKHGLWLIEDNCDALGSTYTSHRAPGSPVTKLTGTFGHIATSSFYPPHHMTMGEGGAVYTNNDELAAIAESIRDWGRDCYCQSGKDNTCGKRFDQSFGALPHGYDHKYVYSHFGYNLKVSDMQAAVGYAQLDKLPDFGEARRRNFKALHAALSKFEDVLQLPQATPHSDPSWFGFLMLVKPGAPFTRREIVSHLESKRIQTRMLFAGNLIKQPCFDEMRRTQTGYRVVGELTNTDLIMENAFLVGVYPGMTDDHLAYIAQSIEDFIRVGIKA